MSCYYYVHSKSVQLCCCLPFRLFVLFCPSRQTQFCQNIFCPELVTSNDYNTSSAVSYHLCCQTMRCFKKHPKWNFIFHFRSAFSSSVCNIILLKARKPALILELQNRQSIVLDWKFLQTMLFLLQSRSVSKALSFVLTGTEEKRLIRLK